jgi:hypothetical protein
MDREPSTPVRRLKDCRIMYRPLRVPTLIAYPPPAPEPARPRPIMALPRVQPPSEAPSWAYSPRSSTRRRRRDCVFIPDMDVALQFIEARRLASEAAGVRARKDAENAESAGLPRLTLDTPVVLGLLMTFVPPLAVTLVWSSSRFSRTAQLALTTYGALTMALLAAVAIAALS